MNRPMTAGQQITAETVFLEQLIALGSLTHQQGKTAFAALKRAGALKIDPKAGRYVVTNSFYLNHDTIRQAAGIKS